MLVFRLNIYEGDIKNLMLISTEFYLSRIICLLMTIRGIKSIERELKI